MAGRSELALASPAATAAAGSFDTAFDTVAARLRAAPPDRPVLIAGPTASGKSALALRIAETFGGAVVNADALQVWSCWRILSARPSREDEARAPHLLYGHRAPGEAYSAGHWLRETAEAIAGLAARGERAVITGGTGLYLTALTEGLADIPPVPAEVRDAAAARLAAAGLDRMAADLDPATAARIDLRNPARVLRAWEVLRATGRGLADWQAGTGAPVLPLHRAEAFVLTSPRDWLAARTDARFDAMLDAGALDEVAAVRPFWDASAPWAQAIGARELVAVLDGRTDPDTAAREAKAATRQYAKRQRTWFRARMRDWRALPVA